MPKEIHPCTLNNPTEQEVEILLESYAAKFRVLGDPLRLKIVLLLREEEKCVCELVNLLGEKQPLISYHLKLMTRVGLILKRKKGTWAYYRLATDVQEWINNCCQFLNASILLRSPGNLVSCQRQEGGI